MSAKFCFERKKFVLNLKKVKEKQTAEKLNINRGTVDYNVRKYKETGSLNRRCNREYLKKPILKEDRYIVHTALRIRRLSVPDITVQINKNLKIIINIL